MYTPFTKITRDPLLFSTLLSMERRWFTQWVRHHRSIHLTPGHQLIQRAKRYSLTQLPSQHCFSQQASLGRLIPSKIAQKTNSQPVDNHGLNPLSRQYRPLREAYEPHISLPDRYCLHQLETEWAKRQPMKGKTVLVNMHLTRFTLTLLTTLLSSGARVEFTVSPELVIHQNALQPLLAANIPLLPTIPDEKKTHYYDLVYDCGAGMKHITPKVGMAELTHTSPTIYTGMSFPVITVDLSQTKVIETGLGTGDSFVQLIHCLAQQSIALLTSNDKNGLNENSPHHRLYLTMLLNLIQIDSLFSQNRFMIFGFGKVGKGIASALESAGTPKKNIFVVDVSPDAYMDAMKQGYCGLFLNHKVPESIEKIKRTFPEMWAVVTATGVEGAMSQYFSQNDFTQTALLANMSTGDDFGPRFTADRILNNKKPANFMLDYPTEVVYLDATFALFLKAGEELLTNRALKNGLNTISPTLDRALLAEWLAQHGDGIWRHRLGRLQTEQRIQALRQHLSLPRPPEETHWLGGQRLFQRPAEAKQLLTSQPASQDKPDRLAKQAISQSPAKPNAVGGSQPASLRHY